MAEEIPKEQKEQAKTAEKAKPQPAQKNSQEQKQQVSSKIKKKLWHQIIAPPMFNGTVLGETIVYDPKSMVGKTITQNLMYLTNDIKKQNINIKFEVHSVENNKALTKVTGFELISSTMKRLVRRGSSKINISFKCKTSDNVDIRVKPLIVTFSITNNSVLSKLNNMTVDFIKKRVQSEPYETFMEELVSHKIQSPLREHLHKVYPLRACEIRYAGIEKKEARQD